MYWSAIDLFIDDTNSRYVVRKVSDDQIVEKTLLFVFSHMFRYSSRRKV